MNTFTAQRGGEWSSKTKIFGATVTEVVRDGRKDGTLSITVSIGGAVARTTRLLDGKAYFEGNALGLNDLDSLTATASKQEADRWISVGKSSPVFAAFSQGLTVSSAAQDLYIGGTITAVAPTTVNGKKVLGVRETVSSKSKTETLTVYVAASGAPLPVETVSDVNGVKVAIVYGPWGTPPHVRVPTKSVALDLKWLSS